MICEILNDDGTMAHWPDVLKGDQESDFPVVQISHPPMTAEVNKR